MATLPAFLRAGLRNLISFWILPTWNVISARPSFHVSRIRRRPSLPDALTARAPPAPPVPTCPPPPHWSQMLAGGYTYCGSYSRVNISAQHVWISVAIFGRRGRDVGDDHDPDALRRERVRGATAGRLQCCQRLETGCHCEASGAMWHEIQSSRPGETSYATVCRERDCDELRLSRNCSGKTALMVQTERRKVFEICVS